MPKIVFKQKPLHRDKLLSKSSIYLGTMRDSDLWYIKNTGFLFAVQATAEEGVHYTQEQYFLDLHKEAYLRAEREGLLP
jgi:hypothetical protein